MVAWDAHCEAIPAGLLPTGGLSAWRTTISGRGGATAGWACSWLLPQFQQPKPEPKVWSFVSCRQNPSCHNMVLRTIYTDVCRPQKQESISMPPSRKLTWVLDSDSDSLQWARFDRAIERLKARMNRTLPEHMPANRQWAGASIRYVLWRPISRPAVLLS
jgi:hypothetical protein